MEDLAAEQVLRVVAAIIWLLAVIAIWRDKPLLDKPSRFYIGGTAILVLIWRISLIISIDFIDRDQSLLRRTIAPGITIALAFALVLAIRAGHSDE